MPTPTIPKPIAITVTSGVKGQPITIRNRTTGDQETGQVVQTTGSQRGYLIDLNNLGTYTAGDIIDISVGGEVEGHATLTTSGNKGESVTVSTTAVTTGLAWGIQ